jgi:uncharacterized membrane protein
MRSLRLIAVASTLLAACGSRDSGPAAEGNESGTPPAATAGPAGAAPAGNGAAARPDLQSSGQGVGNAAAPAAPEAKPAASANPCLVQDGKTLSVPSVRAVGTEPFWDARVEGRCVTYSNPDDQKGTRVWSRFTPGPGGGIWSGSLGGRRFDLKIRSKPGCSDGMSDRRYPLAADLVVGGDRRQGCAEPL